MTDNHRPASIGAGGWLFVIVVTGAIMVAVVTWLY